LGTLNPPNCRNDPIVVVVVGRSRCQGWLAISSLTALVADQTILLMFMKWK